MHIYIVHVPPMQKVRAKCKITKLCIRNREKKAPKNERKNHNELLYIKIKPCTISARRSLHYVAIGAYSWPANILLHSFSAQITRINYVSLVTIRRFLYWTIFQWLRNVKDEQKKLILNCYSKLKRETKITRKKIATTQRKKKSKSR